ncbi:DUF2252 domain-containing protein [Undibacterium sp. JH2W]|uniref:DUF2252 domain-containing protein n=1 Tax=Undibacterium sp. JH2W TaxID=3413037 RepID=UPI003BF145CF
MKNPKQSIVSEPEAELPELLQRLAVGKALRTDVPRASHAAWKPGKKRRDILKLLEQSNKGRVEDLIPIRYGRMLQSPFAFLRGAANIMAFDLAESPVTGVKVQAGGDSHLMNFGEFGTPERNLIFDINDFDETLSGPWEWDIKRLAASVMVAARYRNFPERNCLEAVYASVASYREKMAEYAHMSPLDRWYARIDAQALVNLGRTTDIRKKRAEETAHARAQTVEHLLAKSTEIINDKHRIKDSPPLIYHPKDDLGFEDEMRNFFHLYRHTLPSDRKSLIDQFELVDVVMKVVGVGSVGTRCAVALFMAHGHEPLFLQFKEARASILEPYHGKSQFGCHGQRVVEGQKLMQSASDIFLGWARSSETGIDYYIRQLKDMKSSINIDTIQLPEFIDYAGFCGWALARAHAKSGNPAAISGYLGKSNVFDLALGEFSQAYADQTEADFETLKKRYKLEKL